MIDELVPGGARHGKCCNIHSTTEKLNPLSKLAKRLAFRADLSSCWKEPCTCALDTWCAARIDRYYTQEVKVKGKVFPRTGHEGPKGSRCITLSLTSARKGGWVVNTTPRLV